MDSSCLGDLSSPQKRAIDELLGGQRVANELTIMLNERHADDGSFQAEEDLVKQIVASFDASLCILNRVTSEEVSQFPAGAQVGSPSWDGRKSEGSGDSSKSCTSVKDRRGCYKRKKTSQSWTKDSPIQVEDGYTWRKYGQKAILNAKYPRSYFRCTHKHDQGCQANKQVQMIEDNPPLYRTIYCGKHTCNDLLRVSQPVFESADAAGSTLLNFGDDSNLTHDNNISFFTPFYSVKQEENNKDDIPSNMTYNQSSSSHYLVSPDLSPFDHTDVIPGVISSCTTSTLSLDMGMIDSVVFNDDDLQIEFC